QLVPLSTLVPYTTLFRSDPWRGDSLDTAGLQAFAEYTILAGALADSGTRLGGDAEFVSERWLSAAEEVISRPDYVDVVRRRPLQDRKSTRLNSSHVKISY